MRYLTVFAIPLFGVLCAACTSDPYSVGYSLAEETLKIECWSAYHSSPNHPLRYPGDRACVAHGVFPPPGFHGHP